MKSGQLTYGLGVLVVPAARRRLDLSHFLRNPNDEHWAYSEKMFIRVKWAQIKRIGHR